jgi:hypothetical protein
LLLVEQNESIEEETYFFWEENEGSSLDTNIYSANGEESMEDLLLDPPLAEVPGQVRMETKDDYNRVRQLPAQQYSRHVELRPGPCDT